MTQVVPSTRTIAARIHRAEVALTGLNSDIEIIAALEGSGYTPAKRAEGMSLLTSAQTILGQVQSVRAAQLDATQAFKAAEKSARTAYADLARVVRTLFRNNPAALAALGLDSGAAPKALAAFLLAADRLFGGAVALGTPQAIKDTLASVGYTAAKLAEEHAKIAALHTANQAQEQAKGDSQNLTPEQQRILAELESYISQLRTLAKIALRSSPQLLEKMGVKA